MLTTSTANLNIRALKNAEKLKEIKGVVISTKDSETSKICSLYINMPDLTLNNGQKLAVSVTSYETEAKDMIHTLLQKVRPKLQT